MSHVRPTKTDSATESTPEIPNDLIAEASAKAAAAYAQLLDFLERENHPLQMMSFSHTAKVFDISKETLRRWVDVGIFPRPIKMGTAQTQLFPLSVVRERVRQLIAQQLKI